MIDHICSFLLIPQITTNEGVCLDALETFNANKNSSTARIVNCADTVRQHWQYNFQTQQIIQRISKHCLTASNDVQNAFITSKWNRNSNSGTKESKFNVSTAPCTEMKIQKWLLLPLNWK